MNISVERTTEAILIKLPLDTDMMDLQQILNYLEYVKLLDKSQATQEDIDQIAAEAKQGWWDRNKDRFVDREGFEGLK